MIIEKFEKHLANLHDKKICHLHKEFKTSVNRLESFKCKAFMEYSNDMDDIYKNIEEYNPNKEGKILIAFDDLIADMFSNKKRDAIVTELFISDRKLNVFLVFITQSYFTIPKSVRLNFIHYFI